MVPRSFRDFYVSSMLRSQLMAQVAERQSRRSGLSHRMEEVLVEIFFIRSGSL
jgi:hypothetical protein